MPAAENQADEQDIIVVGKRNDDSRAVWDRDPRHPANYNQPKGEVFISDMRPYEVHRSVGIQQKLGEKELQELGERQASARTAAYDEEQTAREEELKQLREQMAAAPPGATYVTPGTVPQPVQPAALSYAPSPPIRPEDVGGSAVPLNAIDNPDAPENTGDDDETPDDSPSASRHVRRPSRSGDKPDR
jgi:hypothetical protein